MKSLHPDKIDTSIHLPKLNLSTRGRILALIHLIEKRGNHQSIRKNILEISNLEIQILLWNY